MRVREKQALFQRASGGIMSLGESEFHLSQEKSREALEEGLRTKWGLLSPEQCQGHERVQGERKG